MTMEECPAHIVEGFDLVVSQDLAWCGKMYGGWTCGRNGLHDSLGCGPSPGGLGNYQGGGSGIGSHNGTVQAGSV